MILKNKANYLWKETSITTKIYCMTFDAIFKKSNTDIYFHVKQAYDPVIYNTTFTGIYTIYIN